MVGEVSERIAVAKSAVLPTDLKPRIASGLVLAVLAIAANWAGPLALAGLVGLIVILMAWEWGHVVRHTSFDVATLAHALAGAAATALMATGSGAYALAATAVGAATVAAILRDRTAAISAAGVLYTALPAVALVWLRSSEPLGAIAILFVFVVVWTTDTFSYVCGKLIGGPKMWPTISPGKTWAGTVGGVLFAGAAALVFPYVATAGDAIYLPVAGIVLATAAQLGDLMESALKRVHGVKHASTLIPGHGGFMDRMDGIVAAAIMAAMLGLALNRSSPAHGLLYGW